jgi:DNA-binding MarR family transcriptional regulator
MFFTRAGRVRNPDLSWAGKQYRDTICLLPADISSSEYKALAEFRYQIRAFLCFSENAARAAGVEPQQHQLMLAVRAAAPAAATIRYLAGRLQLRHHSVVGLVDRLEGAGLVRRKRSDADRRSAEVQLTIKGSKLLGELSMHHRRELQSAIPALIRSLTLIQQEHNSHAED